ncbi:hypothetical protein [Paenibacillus humicola]|uniref:hypothetical protein n=1 Tax=Paenibacillus humicola TaxID=3110540 RepID=UPI00237A5E42|nr:hypothetical protein [Paenibacillus humicola]
MIQLHHPYTYEKWQESRQAELRQRHKHTWTLADWGLRGLRKRRYSFHLQRNRSDVLKREALHVLEEMLQHENGELRLRAAELILRFSRSKS